jgi:hypothetical protein
MTRFPEMLITFASEAAGRGGNKTTMLPRTFRYIVRNRTLSDGLKVVDMKF